MRFEPPTTRTYRGVIKAGQVPPSFLQDALRREAERIRDQAKAFRRWMPSELNPAEVPVAVDGVVICGQTASLCWCTLPADHLDRGVEVHVCGRGGCRGSWRGEWSDPSSWRMVTHPVTGARGSG